MLSQLWIGSHIRPLKSSTPNMAISLLSAAVYQCHSRSTMQNPFWLFAPLLQERGPSTSTAAAFCTRWIVKGGLLLCCRLIYLFVTHGSIRAFCYKNVLSVKIGIRADAAWCCLETPFHSQVEIKCPRSITHAHTHTHSLKRTYFEHICLSNAISVLLTNLNVVWHDSDVASDKWGCHFGVSGALSPLWMKE